MSTSSIFSGSSRFSTDFQQVVTRSVAIASLPLTQLNNERTTIASKQSAYTAISSKIGAVRTAIDSLTSAAKTSYAASTTSSSVATVTTGAGASAGTYELAVGTAGAYTQYISSDSITVSDPSKENLAAGTSFKLVVNGEETTLTASSLSSLALAINQSGAGVQASIVNLGSPSSPNYRLSVRSTEWKSVNIELKSGAVDLLSNLSFGHEATYTVNGQPATPISTSSPTVTIAPGVTATLAGTGTTTVSVTRNSSALSNALSSVAKAYNEAIAELNKHRGENAGALQGDSQVRALAANLRNLINFDGGQAILKLGLSFDQSGVLSVDTAKLEKQPDDAVAAFLGDGTTAGFLKNADSLLDSMQDQLLPSAQELLTAALERKDSQIAAMQERIDLLELSLNAKMAAADALVASLEQNVSYFTSVFEAMQESDD